MRYLVDGNNLLHAVATHGPGRAVGRVGLCKALADWARWRGVEVGVVFDGPAPPGDLARQMRLAGVAVRFSQSRTADEVIEQDIAESPAPTALTIVTTDRAIQYAARYRRSRCIDSEVFALELFSPPQAEEASPSPAPSEKPGSLTEAETERWLDDFGDDLDDVVDDTELME